MLRIELTYELTNALPVRWTGRLLRLHSVLDHHVMRHPEQEIIPSCTYDESGRDCEFAFS